MRVAIRADASLRLGSGHVMRCLTLADELRARGAHCTFVCRSHAGSLVDSIRARGHDAVELTGLAETARPSHVPSVDRSDVRWLACDWQTDAVDTITALAGIGTFDWLVVDQYGIDERWESMLRPHIRRLLVIDDLADRRHDCDVLLDQNLGRDRSDYAAMVPTASMLLCGAEFALVGPAFANARPDSLARRASGGLGHILVSMGGSDPCNASTRVLSSLADCPQVAHARVSVVMGQQAPSLAAVQEQARVMPCPTEVLCGLAAADMAALMADSDLAIGGAGGTAWERCCLGLPGLLVVLAANQRAGAVALERAHAAVVIGDADDIETGLPSALRAMAQPKALVSASVAAGAIVDGLGVGRVADACWGLS
jgi:UDP-2,4-diacetamido-2,4,6-trideoxy-beta-L-altropyranose hydrolase